MKKKTTVYGIFDDDVVTEDSANMALQNYADFCKAHNEGLVDGVLTQCIEMNDEGSEHSILVQVITNEGEAKLKEILGIIQSVQDDIEESDESMYGEDMFQEVLNKI